MKRSRFCFEWPLSDDTSADGGAPMEAPLLFGRGFRAGIDRVQQIKKRKRLSSSTSAQSSSPALSPSWSHKKLSSMTPRDWRIFQESFGISYKGLQQYAHGVRPMRNWKESGLVLPLLKAVHKLGYKRPSPIQMAAIPLALAHKDAIGIAQTGSGKTASFLLPLLHHISSLPLHETVHDPLEAPGPHALILAPTRELALQIHEAALKLSRYVDVRAVPIVGGHSIVEQGMTVSRGCEIIIATPGRLLDCLERRFVVLNRCRYVVLDEADRIISMGFEEQLVGVLDALPSGARTTCMFSATMPNSVERLARRFLRDPVIIEVGESGKPPDLVTQKVMMLEPPKKLRELQAILDMSIREEELVMVFVNSKGAVNRLVRELKGQGYKVASFHGDLSQEKRETNLRGFKSKLYDCLVATDVAGRGIDIQGTVHVVNYEMPSNIEKYIHRIGRAGRANNRGFATTFLTSSEHDRGLFYDLKQLLLQSNSMVPVELARHEASKARPRTLS